MLFRSACGKITCRYVCRVVRPMARAVSSCDLPTLGSAKRMRADETCESAARLAAHRGEHREHDAREVGQMSAHWDQGEKPRHEGCRLARWHRGHHEIRAGIGRLRGVEQRIHGTALERRARAFPVRVESHDARRIR